MRERISRCSDSITELRLLSSCGELSDVRIAHISRFLECAFNLATPIRPDAISQTVFQFKIWLHFSQDPKKTVQLCPGSSFLKLT